MNRAVLLAALAAVAAVAFVVYGAFSGLGAYLKPVIVNGEAMADRIDHEAGAMIAARFPEVPVGAARCPTLLNLTGGRYGRCTLRTGAGDLRIDVAHTDFGFDYNALTAVDALFVTSDEQRSIADKLTGEYGVRFDVRCPGPAIRIVPPKAVVRCSIRAPGVPGRDMAVTPAGYDEGIGIEELHGVTKRAARAFGAAIAGRRTGSVSIDGPVLERYVALSAALEGRGEIGRRRLVGAAHCQPRVVLHEGSRATCTVRIAGQAQRFSVSFVRKVGLFIGADGEAEVVAVLRQIATRYFTRTRSTGGRRVAVHVDCGPQTVVFTDTESPLPCTVTVDGKRSAFRIDIDEAEHFFAIYE